MRRTTSKRIGRRGLGAWALAALVATACSARPPAPVVVAAAAKPAPQRPSAATAWRVVKYPKAPRQAEVVEVATDGTQRLLVGGMRAEQRGKAVVLAEQATADEITLSCPAEIGYLHRTVSGRFFWSETFLGKLEPGGFVGPEAFGRLEQCGPVIVSDREGTRRLVHRRGVVTLPKNQLFRVGFLTPEQGRAIDAPDRLLETHDGGRTFQELAARPAEAQDSPEAWLAGVKSPPARTEGKDIQSPEAVDAWLRRAVASEVGRLMDGLRLADGTWVRKSKDYHRNYLAFRMPSGQITSYALEGNCEVIPWGDKLLGKCTHNVDMSLFALTAAGIKALPAPPVDPNFIVADPHGKLLAGRASSDDDGVKKTWLLRFDGQRWQVTPEEDWGPLALEGSRLLVTARERHRIVPFEQPDGPGVELPGKPDMGYDAPNVGWSGGEFYYLDASSDRFKVAWAKLDQLPVEETSFELPFVPRQIAFADRLHGIALDNASRDWLTQDGGRTFVRVSEDRNWSLGVACWQHGCALNGALAWTNEPLPVDAALASPLPTAAELEADEATKPPEKPATDDAASSQGYGPYTSPHEAPKTNAPHYLCRATPPLPKKDEKFLEQLLQVSRSETKESVKITIGRANTLFGLVRRQGAGLAWSGHDQAGDFSVEAPALSGAAAKVVRDAGVPLVPRGILNDLPALVPLLVRRGFALLQTVTQGQNELIVVKPDGTTSVLFTGDGAIASVLPSPNGNVAVWMAQEDRQELLWLDASAAVLARRWLLAKGGLLLHDAAEPMAPQFATPGADGSSIDLFTFARGSASRPVSLKLKGPFPECTKPTPPNSRITLVEGFDGPRIEVGDMKSQPLVYPTHWAAPSTAQGVVELNELNEKSSCYRGVLMSDPFPLELHATGPGQMSGTLIGPEGNHRLDCRRAVTNKRATH